MKDFNSKHFALIERALEYFENENINDLTDEESVMIDELLSYFVENR